MTTMDSDSESQDSDDGRRFRFEATRKDATLVSQNRKRVSPHSGRSDQRSRSRGRSDRDRRDTDRALNRNRDSCSRYSSSRNSRDRDSKDRRDRHSSKNYLNDSKDAHDSKHLKHRNGRESNSSLTQKDSKEIKDSRDILSKNSRSHEKDSGNSRESRSSRDRNGKRSRDRSRSDRSSSDKHKIKSHEKNKHPSKDNQNRVKEDQVPEKSDGDANASLALGQIVNDLDKEVADTTQDGCIEFNISDFEIVSDTENSSDASDLSPGQRSKVKKCHSKQQSQQLSDKDSKRKSHRSEKLRKVNPRNGNHSSASSNSNPNALSDFSLGSASPTASSQKKIKEDEEAVTQMEVDAETSHDSSFSPDKVSDDCCTYGPILPPKTVRSLTPDYDKEMTSEISIKVEDSQNEDLEIKKGKKDDLKSKIDVKKEKLIGPPIQPSSSKSSDLDLVEYNQNVKNEPEKVSSSKSLQDEVLLQQNSQSRIVGPTLPAYLLSQKTDIDEDAFGPALPPHLLNKEKTDLENKIIGPMLPSEFRSEGDGESPGQLESDDEDIIGPLPADHPAAKSSIVQQSLEYRAMRIQSEFMSEPVIDERKREEWMTELPAAQSVALGLGPRKFRVRPGPDMSDRSCWTDTPADKARKEKEQQEERLMAKVRGSKVPKESLEAKEGSPEKSKKRQKSLLEMHQKKQKKKKKREEKESKEKGKPMRRPFDRDIDLKANKFDDAQKKHIFMKAQLLDDRFSRGKM